MNYKIKRYNPDPKYGLSEQEIQERIKIIS